MQYHANPNVVTRDRTPLLAAMQKNNLRLIEKLLAAGADPNQPLDDGGTPVSVAVMRDEVPSEILELLLDYGGDPFIKNNKGRSAMDLVSDVQKRRLLEQYATQKLQ